MPKDQNNFQESQKVRKKSQKVSEKVPQKIQKSQKVRKKSHKIP